LFFKFCPGKYGCHGDFEVGDTVHRVGEMVQQAGDMCSSNENKNCCGFFTKAKLAIYKIANILAESVDINRLT
jgi:hypothetical protein